MYELYVDTREPEFIREICDVCELDFVETSLTSGDFALYYDGTPLVGIERKSISDLVGSIQKKRLFSQVDRMRRTYQVSILVISGTLSEYERMVIEHDLKLKPSVITGTIASIMVRNGINVLWFENDDYLLDCVIRVLRKTMEGKNGKVKSTNAGVLRQNPAHALTIIPNVTLSIAEKLIEQFGSVKGVAEATEEELMEVKGVGAKTAEKIKEIYGA